MERQRLILFDLLKCFAIFLVIWGHCEQHFYDTDCLDNPIYTHIYSFHMPLFMMISGYFSESSLKLRFKDFFIRKLTQLLLPCIVWGGILCLINIFINREVLSLSSIGYIFIHNLWFLKSLFCCYLLAYCGLRMFKKNFFGCILLLLCQFYPFNLYIMFPCFLAGMLLRRYDLLWQDQRTSSIILFISTVLFLFLSFYWDKSFWYNKYFNWISFLIHGDVNVQLMALYRQIFRIAIGLSGSMSIIMLFYLIFTNCKWNKFLDVISNWGKYTMGVYIFQSIILEVFLSKYICLGNYENLFLYSIFLPFVSVGILYSCVVLTRLIYRSKVLKFILLGVK